MTEQPKTKARPSSVRRGALLAMQFLLVSALAIACYLAWASLSGSGVAGCGPESDCAQVLNSRWAYWFGIPVGLIALAVYAVMLFGSFRLRSATSAREQEKAWLWLSFWAVILLGAAAWFFSLQLFVIKSFCPYCLAAHALGAAAAVLILFHGPRALAPSPPRNHVRLRHDRLQRVVPIGVIGLGTLIGGQLIHQPKTFVMHPIAMTGTNAGSESRGASNDVAAALSELKAPERSFSIYNGLFRFNLYDVPLVGSPEAPHILISLFDYTCHHCRLMHPRLTEAQQYLSNHIAIVSLPMPLDMDCNPTVTRPIPSHINACQYARIGLAVWRANRSAFEAYNHWFFEPERPWPLEVARAYAGELVGASALESALQDSWIDQQVKTDVAIYEVAYRGGRGSMPQLIVGTNVYLGILSKEDLGRALAQQLWGQ